MTPNFGVLGNVPNTDLYRSLGEETCTDPPPLASCGVCVDSLNTSLLLIRKWTFTARSVERYPDAIEEEGPYLLTDPCCRFRK